MPRSGISIEIPINGILRRDTILAYFDDPRYRRSSSGMTKYGRCYGAALLVGLIACLVKGQPAL